MTADQREIQKALSLLFSEGAVVELRALGDGGVHSGYFTNFDKLTDQARILDAFNDVHGVYVTLNEVNPALLSRRANRVKQRLSRTDATTADADITRRRWLPIDLDPVRPSGVSATDAEHTAALERAEEIACWLTEQGFPAPILADSGNGAHLLYRIDLQNDGEATRLVKTCLTVLDVLFSDDTVHCDTANFNAGRIWKCYGTTACKGDNTPERPHRQARIVSAPDEPMVVTADQLEGLAAFLPSKPPEADRQRRRGSFDLGDWLEKQQIAVKNSRPWHGGTLYVLADCPFSSAHTDGAFAIQFANGAVFAGCHHNSCGGGMQRWQELKGMYEERKEGKKSVRREKKRSGTSSETSGSTVPSPPPAPDDLSPEEDHCRRARTLLESGDPLTYLLDTFNREHVGDRAVAECLVMSIASQSVENTHGIHVSISGISGRGKSHACSTMLRQVPPAYRLESSVSDKALYYNTGIRAGTVFLFDDKGLSDDMQEILKSATAAFRERIEHQTLTADRHLKVCSIPERCVWWLAKVEDVGDDQVMNRLLTTWIDDTREQDQRVLDHLRHAEAVEGEAPTRVDDLLVCQAVWEMLKQEIITVQIPFAERVRFTATQNRRNPNMLFDLIKSHALLFRFQRERFTTIDGGDAIRATEDDFVAAARLYRELHTGAGGQETKLTKNEAAALKTIEALDVPEFTARELQRSLGVSYNQVRRVFHGYTSRGKIYSGLLEKCPALSYVDVTVTTDSMSGPVRKRENVYTFDRGAYRQWNGVVDVWLEPEPANGDGHDDHGGSDDTDGHDGNDYHDDNREIPPGPDLGDDVGGMAAGWRQDGGKFRQRKNDDSQPLKTDLTEERETFIQENRGWRKNKTTQHAHNDTEDHLGSGCALTNSANQNTLKAIQGDNAEKTDLVENLDGGRFRHLPPSAANAANVGFGCVCESRHPPGVIPLSGILDHTTFRRSPVSLGTCAICGEGAAVYQSKEQQTSICDACYARLVQEWNQSEGVV